jgi:uncharacterized membrane protein YhdT
VAASQLLLRLLVTRFASAGELVFGLEDTIERRRGDRITAKSTSRDPVRSSQAHFVKASGLRWLYCMLLVHKTPCGRTLGHQPFPVWLKISAVSTPLKLLRLGVYWITGCYHDFHPEERL